MTLLALSVLVTRTCARPRVSSPRSSLGTDRLTVPGKRVYACMLGGTDGRTPYLCTAKTTGPELARGISTG